MPNSRSPRTSALEARRATSSPRSLARLSARRLRKNPGAVVTEYAWDASSCDPCPGPTLDGNDLATLGADVLGGRTSSFTLTRLHARYGKDVKDDLVFRAVEPISGGRGIPDEHGALPTGMHRGAGNDFQGRYVILHPWTAALTCAAPQPRRWADPPPTHLATRP